MWKQQEEIHRPGAATLRIGRSAIAVPLALLVACGSDSSVGPREAEDPAAPEADFTASPTSGLFPLTVTFDASTSAAFDGTIVSYDWDFGDGASGSGRIVTHVFEDPGLYTVSLTVTNNVGDTDERTVEDMIYANRTIWRYDVDKAIYYSAPAVGTDGTIYVATGLLLHHNEGRVHAVTPDGTGLWSADLDEHTPPPDGTARAENNGSSPAIGPDGTVYVVDHRNVIYAFDPATGARRWTNNDYESARLWAVGQKTPAIADDGTLYVCIDYSLVALDPADGSEVWRQDDLRGANACATSAVLDADGVVYVASNDWFYAFEPDGSPHWPAPFEMTQIQEKSYSSPAIGEDGVIYFGAEATTPKYTGFVYALNPGGTLRWRYEVPGDRLVRASPAIGSDGTVYVTTKAYYEGGVAQPALCLAFDPDGTVKWSYEIPPTSETINADSYTSPAIGADGTIYFAAENGYIFALDSDGELLWTENFGSTINWSSPYLTEDGTLYIGGARDPDYAGRLVAVQTESPGLDDGPWPKFRGNARNTGRGR